MTPRKVVILGAGAAGTSAERVLAASDAVTVALVGRTGETPYNRTLVNKGVAVGLLTPEQVATRGVTVIADTGVAVDTTDQTVQLASGRQLDYDALIVATGSVPRGLDDTVPGVVAATASEALTTLHSLDDAIRVRDLLTSLGRPARVVISGAGLVAAETASLLRERGHEVTLLARSAVPGATVFGPELAQQLAHLHRSHLNTAFGRSVTEIYAERGQLTVALDDGTMLPADLLLVAHGTTPVAPAPWAGAVGVDETLRTGTPGVYAAGGVALHHDPLLGSWRIDHWADAAAQGEHAARAVVADLGAGEDPGRYLPRATFTATVHGALIAGAGLTGDHASARTESTDPLMIIHTADGVPVGVLGIDAAPAVFGWIPKLHTRDVAPVLAASGDSNIR